MKLVAAKCPSCGASIDVDQNSDSTVCEFCHTKIIVEEAIQKLQISGSVEISNLPKIENLLILANRHYKNFEMIEAEKEFNKVLELNPNILEAILKRGVCKCALYNDIYAFSDGVKDAYEILKRDGDLNNQSDSLLVETMDKVSSFGTIYIGDLEKDNDLSKFHERIDGLVDINKFILDNVEMNEDRKKHVLNTLVSLLYGLCIPDIDTNKYYYGEWEKYSNELEKVDTEYASEMVKARANEEIAKENQRKQIEADRIAAIKYQEKVELEYKGRFRWWVVLIELILFGTLGGFVDNCVNYTIPVILLVILGLLSIPYILVRLARGKLFLGYLGIIVLYVGTVLLEFFLDVPFLHETYVDKKVVIHFNNEQAIIQDNNYCTYHEYTYEKIDAMSYYVYFNDQTYKVTYTNDDKTSAELCLLENDKCKRTYVSSDRD